MPGVFGAMRDWLRGPPDDRPPTARLAVFGKHPGWDDHIDDIGLDTDELVMVRRTLYTGGIASNIDSGYWGKLEPDDRIAKFGHVFLWQVGPASFVGRLWPTSDGKGRTKYPMVACAQIEGLSPDVAIKVAWPELERLEAGCAATTDAGAVRQLTADASQSLQQAVAQHPEALLRPEDAIAALRTSGMFPEQGLQRVMYRLDPNRTGLLDDAYPEVRVPSIGRDADALAAWVAFLSLWGGSSSRLLIHGLEGGWIDTILGAAQPAALSCLLRSPRSLPLTSEVPYSLEPAFLSWADHALAQVGR